MEIKEYISKVIERVTQDGALRTQFQTDPIKAVEQVLGVDLNFRRISCPALWTP